MNRVKPVFLLAGGNFKHPRSMVPLMARALNECGASSPRVAYIGAASGDNPAFFLAMKALLGKAGAAEVVLVRLAKNGADLPSARQVLDTADAVFLSGGEVDDGMRWLELHGMVDFLAELRSRGKLFFGVSAGSIMMGTHWVHWDQQGNDDTAKLFRCLGFAPTIFDTHAEDEDWKELKTALRLKGSGSRGYGIRKGGMVIVDNQGRMEEAEQSLIPFINIGGQIQQEQKEGK